MAHVHVDNNANAALVGSGGFEQLSGVFAVPRGDAGGQHVAKPIDGGIVLELTAIHNVDVDVGLGWQVSQRYAEHAGGERFE